MFQSFEEFLLMAAAGAVAVHVLLKNAKEARIAKDARHSATFIGIQDRGPVQRDEDGVVPKHRICNSPMRVGIAAGGKAVRYCYQCLHIEGPTADVIPIGPHLRRKESVAAKRTPDSDPTPA